ncbi:unnamed protein product [Cylicocyclus nassatus]|uniref:Uncharacterized protein n=1 Tax=Cylicocyclus nassatus TaxID=53992 RepID=A0AA36GHR8_CYLNA|nr:unnamed protein product [Cylicocyclus nassatus]
MGKEATHSRLKQSELEWYSACFAEYKNGADAKRPTSSIPYPELFLRMQPVMYSVCDALAGHCGWVRAGETVCYYRNLYSSGEDSDAYESKSKKRRLYQLPFNVCYSNDVIGESLRGNSLNLLTVTAEGTREQINSRDIVFLSSPVHPGESNSSWTMHD